MSTDDPHTLLDRLDPLADAHRLIAAVVAVLDEHPRYEGDFSDFCGHCQARGEGTWPCPTVTAIHAALIGGDDVIREAKAEAWEEGHAAGCADPYARYGECGCGPNLYRADLIEQGVQP